MSPEASRHRRRIGGLLISNRLPFDYIPEKGKAMGHTIICCSCDEHYGGDALACAKAIAAGTTTPCRCDCHRATPLPGPEEFAVLEEQFKVACRKAESYKEALSMIAQIIHGSTRTTRMIAEAALAGADFTDEETAIKVAEGKWRRP